MANWVVFNNTAAKPQPLAINLDLVKAILPGSARNTISLDGTLVSADFATLLLMITHTTYPGAISSPITTT